MFNIIKQGIEKGLKQKLEFICDFCNVTPTIINRSLRKLDKTNVNYIEPYKVIIKNITFLVFNYSTDIYIKKRWILISNSISYKIIVKPIYLI